MTNPILSTWQMHDEIGGPYSVLPDGCCDLVWKHSDQGRPIWSITTLQSQAENQVARPNTRYNAIRFKPGTKFNHPALLAYVQMHDGINESIIRNVAEFAQLDDDLSDTLTCLSVGESVAMAARRIGISTRTLQRHVVRETGQTPVFWSLLARARQAARDISAPPSLSDIAFANGFADQAHMTREFRRWFGVSPKQMRRDKTLQQQVNATGFG